MVGPVERVRRCPTYLCLMTAKISEINHMTLKGTFKIATKTRKRDHTTLRIATWAFNFVRD